MQSGKPSVSDPDELLRHRFLSRGGGLLLVGQTGLGKSSLSMQMMIKWALGKALFGIEPVRPLRSLLIQAENDDGDLAEMRDGVFNGLNLSPEDRALAEKNIYVVTESSKTSENFFKEVVEPLLKIIKPDVLWIDPALSYLGGDMSSQKDVGKFLRNDLAPLLTKYSCAAVIIHHTNKTSSNADKNMMDPAYLGAGSAEWINWARAMLVLKKTDVLDLSWISHLVCNPRTAWVVFVIFCLLPGFARHFSSPPLVFARRGRCFDAIVGSKAHFLPAMKTPPPLLPWFSCDSFHFSSSGCCCW